VRKLLKSNDMKKETILTATLLLYAVITRTQIDQLESPFWWAGMNPPSLQLPALEPGIIPIIMKTI